MARRRRGQFPQPRKENKLWKIRYWADVAQPDGSIKRKKRTKCLGRVEEITLTQARKEAQRFLQPINDVEESSEYTEKTMNDLIGQWTVLVKPNLKLSTQLSYEWAFNRIQRTFGPLAVSSIEKAEVQAFLTSVARELAPESVHDLRNRLSGLFTSAEEWGWIRSGSNPARGKLRMPERVAVRKKQIPKPEEFQDLLLLLNQPYSTIVTLAALSGLRKGEIEALRWNDVEAGYVEVDEAVYRRELGTPKSRKSRRRVAIGPAVQKVLEDWRREARFTNPEDFVFAMRTNSPIDLHNAVARHVKPACVRLGLPLVSWHDFRHTYTTWGRKAGVKAEVMRDQLGHESVQVTLDTYSHVDDRETEARQVEQYALADDGTLNGTPTESSHAATR